MTYSGWKLIHTIGLIQVWKTPTMYLTCIKYFGVFRFFRTLKEAIDEANKLKETI